jgi:serine/threonine-protein kinase
MTDAIRLAVTLADVTNALHRSGILHRDIKPSNIGFTTEGVTKLLDFGMARLVARSDTADPVMLHSASGRRSRDAMSQESSTEGRIAGTLPYLSPEAVSGAKPDVTLDLWSICVVLYESLTGTNPAQAATPLMTMQRIATCDFPDIRTHLPDIEAALPAFFEHAFASDISIRPRTAEDLRDRLTALGDRLRVPEVT